LEDKDGNGPYKKHPELRPIQEGFHVSPDFQYPIPTNVYEKLKFDKDFIEILEAHPRFVAEKKNYEFVMQLMFSFDTLDLFHLCLIYLLYKYRPMPSAIESSNAEAGIGTGTGADANTIDNVSLYVIPNNVYSYFTFLDTKNKLIEILKI
jgi:hypothetical protein